MRRFFYIIGSYIHRLFLPILRVLDVCFKYLRTGFLGYELKSIGSRTSISRGCSIIGGENIVLGRGCTIGKYVTLSTWQSDSDTTPNITIGNSVSIGEGCHITSTNQIFIGNNTLLGKYITITDNSHGDTIVEQLSIAPISRPLKSKGPVIIGERVWIGDKVTILPNVKIGNSVIIGANSLVSKDVPDNSVCVGNPARVIKRIV